MKEVLTPLRAQGAKVPPASISLEEMDRVKKKLLEASGLDFSDYRDRLLMRRILSHMKSKGISNTDVYLEWLEANGCEFENLVEALTVKYTMFFRDPPIFDLIYRKVLPALTERKRRTKMQLVRAWSAGCASGEEAYSLAILLWTFMQRQGDLDAVVIGTDIDLGHLGKARHGEFSSECMDAVRAHAKSRFFVQKEGKFQVAPHIRSMVRFKLHDLVTDPPLMGTDLIFCRNVLMYFKESLQKRIIRKFYDALDEGGILVLGKVEGLLGETGNLFERLDRREQIFMRKP